MIELAIFIYRVASFLNPTICFSLQKNNKTQLQLRNVLNDPRNNSVIDWLPHGKSFKVFNVCAFEEDVLPRAFHTNCKYWSFTRRLARWGFVRITTNRTEFGAYYHPMFQKDDPSLMVHMKYVQTSAQSKASIPQPVSKGDLSTSVSPVNDDCSFNKQVHSHGDDNVSFNKHLHSHGDDLSFEEEDQAEFLASTSNESVKNHASSCTNVHSVSRQLVHGKCFSKKLNTPYSKEDDKQGLEFESTTSKKYDDVFNGKRSPASKSDTSIQLHNACLSDKLSKSDSSMNKKEQGLALVFGTSTNSASSVGGKTQSYNHDGMRSTSSCIHLLTQTETLCDGYNNNSISLNLIAVKLAIESEKKKILLARAMQNLRLPTTHELLVRQIQINQTLATNSAIRNSLRSSPFDTLASSSALNSAVTLPLPWPSNSESRQEQQRLEGLLPRLLESGNRFHIPRRLNSVYHPVTSFLNYQIPRNNH